MAQMQGATRNFLFLRSGTASTTAVIIVSMPANCKQSHIHWLRSTIFCSFIRRNRFRANEFACSCTFSVVCRLSRSCTLLKLFDGFRYVMSFGR